MYAKQDAFTLLQNSWIFCRHCRSISNLGEKLYSKLQASGLKAFPRHQVRQPWPFPRLSATLFGIEPLPHGNCLCFCQVILFQGCFDLIYDLLKIRSPSFRHFHHQSKLFQAISGAVFLSLTHGFLPGSSPAFAAALAFAAAFSNKAAAGLFFASVFGLGLCPIISMLLFLRHPAAWPSCSGHRNKWLFQACFLWLLWLCLYQGSAGGAFWLCLYQGLAGGTCSFLLGAVEHLRQA